MFSLVIALTALIASYAEVDPPSSGPQPASSKDWNEKIAWIEDLDEGLEKAEKEKKPVMMVVHRTWCHACKNLSPKFAKSPGIEALSKYFVMISIGAENEPWQEEYQPGGARYVPRIMFADSEGKLLDEVYNDDKAYKGYKWFYPEPSFIIKSMKKALDKVNIRDPSIKRIDNEEAKEE